MKVIDKLIRPRKFPITSQSFAALVERKEGEYVRYFVDKTYFIQKILDSSANILLFPRFRRSGKSTNLDMVRCFFDIREKEANRKLFQGLKIEKAQLANQDPCLNYQGRYPVIFMDFKKLCQNNFKEMYEQFKILLSDIYGQHRYLLASSKLEKDQKEIIQAIIERKADDAAYKNALKHLMEYLYHYHDGKKVIVLIDEYDVPFQQAIHEELYGQEKIDRNYFKELKSLFTVFLGDALKGNDQHLEKCVMTGIVRIAGAGIFSQLNNLDVWTILDDQFSDCFGFTEEELIRLLEETGNKEKLDQFREWYNGYRFGNTIIYNPWSVMKCLDRNKFDTYWLDTSNNDLVRDKLLNCRNTQEECEVNEMVAQLISGKEVKKTINASLIYDNRIETIEHLWVLLLSTGYLKVTSREQTGAGILSCSFAIPNIEIKSIYERIFTDWLSRRGITEKSPLIQHLLAGRAEEFCKELDKLFKNVVSVRDTVEKKPGKKALKEQKEDESYEAYYHGFMVGILGLGIYAAHHKVMLTSNRESGYGFYDLLLEPKDPNDPVYKKAVIFEFKRCLEEKDLEKEAKAALKQIKEKEYTTNLHERGVKTIVLIGVAFHKKRLKSKHEEMSTDKLLYKASTVVTAAKPTVVLDVSLTPALSSPLQGVPSLASSATLKASSKVPAPSTGSEPEKKKPKLSLTLSSQPSPQALPPSVPTSKPSGASTAVSNTVQSVSSTSSIASFFKKKQKLDVDQSQESQKEKKAPSDSPELEEISRQSEHSASDEDFVDLKHKPEKR